MNRSLWKGTRGELLVPGRRSALALSRPGAPPFEEMSSKLLGLRERGKKCPTTIVKSVPCPPGIKPFSGTSAES